MIDMRWLQWINVLLSDVYVLWIVSFSDWALSRKLSQEHLFSIWLNQTEVEVRPQKLLYSKYFTALPDCKSFRFNRILLYSICDDVCLRPPNSQPVCVMIHIFLHSLSLTFSLSLSRDNFNTWKAYSYRSAIWRTFSLRPSTTATGGLDPCFLGNRLLSCGCSRAGCWLF